MQASSFVQKVPLGAASLVLSSKRCCHGCYRNVCWRAPHGLALAHCGERPQDVRAAFQQGVSEHPGGLLGDRSTQHPSRSGTHECVHTVTS